MSNILKHPGEVLQWAIINSLSTKEGRGRKEEKEEGRVSE